MTEILGGGRTALAQIQEAGENALQTDLIIDARSALNGSAAADTKSTTDKLMLVHALELKEILSLRIASRLTWIDVRDMLRDGLNKGSGSRDAVRARSLRGVWQTAHPIYVC